MNCDPLAQTLLGMLLQNHSMISDNREVHCVSPVYSSYLRVKLVHEMMGTEMILPDHMNVSDA